MKISKILAFSGNLTQYHAPFYKLLNREENVDLTVLYADKIGAEKFIAKNSMLKLNGTRAFLKVINQYFLIIYLLVIKKDFFQGITLQL